MATSLQSPALVFASNAAIIAARANLAKVKEFSTNFSNEATQPGTTLKVPVFLAGPAQDFDKKDSNYETANGSVVYVPMTFDIHKHSTFSFDDKDFLLVNGTQFWQNSGKASGEAIAEGLVEAICGEINATNVPTSGLDPNYTEDDDNPGYTKGGCPIPTFSANNEQVLTYTKQTLKGKIAKLRAVCKKVGIKPGRSVLAVNSDLFADILDLLDANIYGGANAIQDGIVPKLFGFKSVMECDEFGTGADLGAVIPEDALAIAGRAIPVGSPKCYEEVGTTTDEGTGIVLTTRRHGNPATGENFATIEALFGKKLIQPTKVIRIKSEDESSSSSSSSSSSQG